MRKMGILHKTFANKAALYHPVRQREQKRHFLINWL